MKPKLGLIFALVLISGPTLATDHGQWTEVDPKIHEWVEGLHAPSGFWCCHLADGELAREVEWDSRGDHYRVRVDGQWYDVPPEAVIREPNRFGRALV